MKRIFFLILALIMCLPLCACGVSKEKIREKVEENLQGTWEYTWYAEYAGFYCSSIYEFDDGFLKHTFVRNNDVTTRKGFYIITDDVIEIFLEGDFSKPYCKITYTYEDEELTLVDYGDGTVANRYSKV